MRCLDHGMEWHLLKSGTTKSVAYALSCRTWANRLIAMGADSSPTRPAGPSVHQVSRRRTGERESVGPSRAPLRKAHPSRRAGYGMCRHNIPTVWCVSHIPLPGTPREARPILTLSVSKKASGAPRATQKAGVPHGAEIGPRPTQPPTCGRTTATTRRAPSRAFSASGRE